MIQLFAFQEEAVSAIVNDVKTEKMLLLQCPTGGGKTIIFSELIRRFMSEYHMRVLVLAHREILAKQSAEKLRRIWPDAPIGLACASLGQVDIEKPVVIGTVQTVVSRLGECPPFHLVIVDEAHHIKPPEAKDSQFNTVINQLRSYYHDMRVLGVTATPFRLGHGFIYGDHCKDGSQNWFPRLNFQITMEALQEAGRLVNYRGMQAVDMDDVLLEIGKVGGEFNEGQLSKLMQQGIHLDSAVEAYQEHGEHRNHVVIFAVDIEHAETLVKRFEAAGYQAGAVHSKMSQEDRNRNLALFQSGAMRFIVNVGVLTEGWDAPLADLLLLCRPTMSPALHIQMVGRGLRTCAGKEDCLILDLAGNFKRHGHPDHPNVVIPGEPQPQEPNDRKNLGTRPCPSCEAEISIRAWVCPVCNAIIKPVANLGEMIEIGKAPSPKVRSVDPVPAIRGKVISSSFDDFTSKKGNRMVRLSMLVKTDGDSAFPIRVQHYIDVEGRGRYFANRWWTNVAGKLVLPRTVDLALEQAREIEIPETVSVAHDGKFWRVVGW
jgi:DNA repair protein RadD